VGREDAALGQNMRPTSLLQEQGNPAPKTLFKRLSGSQRQASQDACLHDQERAANACNIQFGMAQEGSQ